MAFEIGGFVVVDELGFGVILDVWVQRVLELVNLGDVDLVGLVLCGRDIYQVVYFLAGNWVEACGWFIVQHNIRLQN